jgi:hypothetical protein
MKYYSDNYATIEWNPELKCVKTTLTGIPRHSHHFRMIQRKRIEFISLLKDRFSDFTILTDSRKAGPLIPEDVNFFKTKILPRLASLGVTRVAVLEPESIFSKLVIRDMIEGATKVKLALFSSEEMAKDWLSRPTEVEVAA